jgi:hypothetical protein
MNKSNLGREHRKSPDGLGPHEKKKRKKEQKTAGQI